MSTVPRSSFASTVAQRVVLVVLLLTAWWLASLRMPQFVLPGPLRVAHAFVGLVQSGTFFDDLGITLYRVVAGFLLAAAVGAPLGIALGSNPRVAHFFEPLLSIVNTVSSAIWAVFAIIWFGISNATTIFVVFMTAMPLILTNVWQGALTVDSNHVELARSFRMSQTQIMRKIFLPTILPHFSLARASRSVSAGVCHWWLRLSGRRTALATACGKRPISCRPIRSSRGPSRSLP